MIVRKNREKMTGKNQTPDLDKENPNPDIKNQNKDFTEVTPFVVPDIVDISDQDLEAASQITDN